MPIKRFYSRLAQGVWEMKLEDINAPTKNAQGEYICNRCGKPRDSIQPEQVTFDQWSQALFIWLCMYCRGVETKQRRYQR
jgi:hypothetical protein